MISRFIALLLIVILSPILLFTSFYIFFLDGLPVLFKQKEQERVKHFFIYINSEQ